MRHSTEPDREHDRRPSRSGNGSSGHHDGAGNGSGGGARRLSAPRAVAAARENLEALTNHPVEAVSGLVRTRDGWAVSFEVVELERVPRSTDLMATFRVEVDNDGELLGYDRVQRYYRNQACGE
jgi:hypothetical protein